MLGQKNNIQYYPRATLAVAQNAIIPAEPSNHPQGLAGMENVWTTIHPIYRIFPMA